MSLRKFFSLFLISLRGKTKRQPEKAPEKEPEIPTLIKPKGTRKGTKYWHYNVCRKTVVRLYPNKKGVLSVEKNIGPVVMGINEKSAILNGERSHEKTLREQGL